MKDEFKVQGFKACSERSEESFLDLVRSFETQDARGAHFEPGTLNGFAFGEALFLRFAEIISNDSFLDIFQSTQILNDVAAGIIEENITFVIPPDGHEPLQLVAVFQ